MTINIGWISGESCYLVADSLLSAESESARGLLVEYLDEENVPKDPHSTFAEVLAGQGSSFLEEGGAKAIQVSDTVAAVYCGDIGSAVAALVRLRTLLYTKPVREAIAECASLVHSAQLLIASYDEGGPRIWKISDGSIVEHYEEGSPIIAGSGAAFNHDFIRATIAALRSLILDGDDYLAAVICACQARGQRINTLPYRFGGSYWGIRTDSVGNHPCKDRLFVLYDGLSTAPAGVQVDGMHLVLAGTRNHIDFLYMPHRKAGRALVTDVRPILDDEIRRLFAEIEDYPPQPSYVSFVERRSGGLLVVAREPDDESQVAIRYEEETKVVAEKHIAQLLRSISGTPAVAIEVPLLFFKVSPRQET